MQQFNLGQFEKLGQFQKLGQGGDDKIGHLMTGEIVVSPKVLGTDLIDKINSKMKGFGLNPDQYTVGNKANSINPATGLAQFTPFFGSSGTAKYLKELKNKFGPEIEATKYSTQGMNTPYGSISYGEDGVNVTPSDEARATSSMFAGLAPDFLDRLTQNTEGQELRDFYQQNAPTRSREELEQLYLGAIDYTDIDRATDNMFSSKFGSSGLNTGSASAMGEFDRQANLEKQQRRISAYDAVNRDKYNEFTNFQNMLAGTQAFRGANLDNLMNASRAQYSPYEGMFNYLNPSMMYNQSRNQFEQDKLSGRIDLDNLYAQYKATPKAGAFQKAVLPTLKAGADLATAWG